jgi:hypothetical protein
MSDEGAAVHDHVVADGRVRADDCAGSDDRPDTQPCRSRHMRSRMNHSGESEAEACGLVGEAAAMRRAESAHRLVCVCELGGVVDPQHRKPVKHPTCAITIVVLDERRHVEFVRIANHVGNLG